jgi:hypothetical protein
MTIRWRVLILFLVSGAACAVYLYASSRSGYTGFPLDDAWIHQTYARNLVELREWAFLPGRISAGSTAPLWTGILSIGYALRLDPYLWTFGLGWMLLFALSAAGMLAYSKLCPGAQRYQLAAGILLAVEWHLVWAAVSGMETLLIAALNLCVLTLLLNTRPPWLVYGLLVGLSVWMRPDGIALLAPALLVLLLDRAPYSDKLRSSASLGLGFALLGVPYLMFNRFIAGAWMPNTFFAKQAEYAIELESSLFSRIGEQAVLPLVGVGVLLLPGFIYLTGASLISRDWRRLAGVLWVLGFIGLYALRLPVTYQHGRYLMPVMPVYFIWGLAGITELAMALPNRPAWRILVRAWSLSIILVMGIFFLLGARAYQRDVAFIEEEMVQTARWVATNTPKQARIAAHDIGALGYFARRELIDLAGLVSPEVIPFIRDQARLADYLDDQRADFLVAFPGWYPHLVSQAQRIYVTHGQVSQALGAENMAVYRWRHSP